MLRDSRGMEQTRPGTPWGLVWKVEMLLSPWLHGGSGRGPGQVVLGMMTLVFRDSEAWYCSRNGRQAGFGASCWSLVLTICSTGQVTDDVSQLTHSARTSILLEEGSPEISCGLPLCFCLSVFVDMSKTCPPGKLQSRADLRQGLQAWCCQSWQNMWAFPARLSLVPDKGGWSRSEDSFVVSNQIVCLGLMNVWKEPLVCMGQQK